MAPSFRIALEYVGPERNCHVFRLAFDASSERWLLPYPEVTDLKFTDECGNAAEEWRTGVLGARPKDEFVLNLDARVAFDLKVYRSANRPSHSRWSIELPEGVLYARYVFRVEPDMERYEKAAARSRFAAMTKPWGGTMESNVVRFVVLKLNDERSKC